MTPSLKGTSCRCRPNGFTVVEVAVVGMLMSLLVLLISGAWTGPGRSSADAIVRCRVLQEANLAIESLTRDFGGSLPEQIQGEKQSGRFVGRVVVDNSRLRLCFDGQPVNAKADWGAPDTVIVYQVQEGRLVRSNQQTATAFVTADNVDQMQLTEQADGVTIELTFNYRDLTRTYTIVAKDP